jgi:hypothetical protein
MFYFIIEMQIDNLYGITGDKGSHSHVVALIIKKAIRSRESAG